MATQWRRAASQPRDVIGARRGCATKRRAVWDARDPSRASGTMPPRRGAVTSSADPQLGRIAPSRTPVLAARLPARLVARQQRPLVDLLPRRRVDGVMTEVNSKRVRLFTAGVGRCGEHWLNGGCGASAAASSTWQRIEAARGGFRARRFAVAL